MPVQNNLKQKVDMPVWEWCRFAPATVTAVSSMTTGNSLTNRYLYYQVSNLLYRYDTVTDSWHQLQSTPANTPTIMNENGLSNAVGHYGQAIAGGVNTIQLAGLSGNTLVGYKIRILSGTGAGQERTITAVSAPIVADRGLVTTASSTQVIDASTGVGLKQWRSNQWMNYQVRIDFGTGRTQLRPILYNTPNTLTFSDVNHITVNPWSQCPLNTATVANSSLYVIESHQVTVDTNWTTQPDATSNFVILSGGIWNISQGTTSAPFFSFMYYDVLADYWYQKSTQTGLKTAVFTAASDLSMERFTETGGRLFTETAAGGGARFITPTATLTPYQYANFEIRIVGGLGIGQVRTILSNSANRINVARDWDINPDNTSVYEIWRDNGKVLIIGGGDAGMLMYSLDTDQFTTGKQLDWGQCNQLAAKKAGQAPFALTSITRTATGVVSLSATPTVAGSNYNINDILTITTGGSGATARVTGIDALGGVTSVSLETVGTGYTTGTGKATTVAPTGGTGCTLNILTVDFTELAVTPIAHNFKIGDSVTMTGASGTGAAKFNGTYTILGVATNNLSFSYSSVGDPGAATATIANSPSATQLVDCTKNWAVNEHAGKLVQLATNAVLSTGQVRRIVSNTATTLVWTLAATAPVNGTSRYVIEDIKPFGTELSSLARAGGGIEGFATSGTATSLTDTTKNWQPNLFSRNIGRKVRIVEGTGVGNELTIVSNTSNTLNYLAPGFTADTTTRYEIQECVGTVSAAGGITTVSATPTAGGTGYAVGDISNVTGGTARVRVLAVSGGVATVIQLMDGGLSGYTVTSGVATTNVIGTGINMTVNVTAITAVASTTSFADNTKNWDVNAYVGKRVRFLSGTSQGNEYAITANTATTITYATGTAPDVSTAYAILESSPKTFGMNLDNITGCSDITCNHKYLYSFSGSATPEISRYNINTEHWELMSCFPQFETLTTGSMYVYDGADRIYFTKEATGRVMYYDVAKNIIVPSATIPYGMSTAVSGNRMEIIQTEDGLKYLYVMRHSATEMWRLLLWY